VPELATIRLNIDGDNLRKLLREVDVAVRGRVAKKAITAGLRPILRATKKNAPVETGVLKQSLIQVSKLYSYSGVAVGLVGPKSGFKVGVIRGRKFQRRWPAKYAHLAEKHTKFLQRSLDASKGAAVEAMSKVISEELGR
jgi:hypothetical protein